MSVAHCALRAAEGYVPAPTNFTLQDTFSRPDSTSSLGTADTGQVWSALAGVWGISSGRAYMVTQAGDTMAAIDCGKADIDLSCDVTVNGKPGVMFRCQDANNTLMMFYNTGNGIQLYRKISGTYTLMGTTAITIGSGAVSTWRIVATGQTITLYVGGVQQLQVTNANYLLTATKVGIRINDASAPYFDNLTVV